MKKMESNDHKMRFGSDEVMTPLIKGAVGW